ncbi:FkbM family methyltransferase [Trichothermofontia sp.]
MELKYSTNLYIEYIDPTRQFLHSDLISTVNKISKATSWDNPKTALDWNNLAVTTLIEAERADDLAARSTHFRKALEILNQAVNLGNHPLPFAHLAVLKGLISPSQNEQIGNPLTAFINLLINAFHPRKTAEVGLIYVPPTSRKFAMQELTQLQIINILRKDNGYTQSLCLLSEVLCHSALAFYNTLGLRLLNLAVQLFPDSAVTHLKLGLSNLSNGFQEGLFNLHRAQVLAPQVPAIRQALYLAYRDMKILDLAKVWLRADGVQPHQGAEQVLSWRWTELTVDAPVTYVPFEGSLLMAVEPSLRSIVTKVLVAEGDWFEHEMEFWRYWLKPGMTVIDVGANVGIYTFSAARRVGPTGRVYAIEPFSRCVQYMEMTKQLNQLDWVTVCQGAASDRNRTVRLSLSTASETNKVMADDDPQTVAGAFEEVTAFPLDDLISQEQLSQVHWLKIDAEGHEMQVLKGSDRLLTEFMPGILYENMTINNAINLSVAEYLQGKGYKLFRYQPYLRQLIPIGVISDDRLSGILNIIALPLQKLDDFVLQQ